MTTAESISLEWPAKPPEPDGPARSPRPPEHLCQGWEHCTLRDHLFLAHWRMLGDAPALRRSGPWSWTVAALARDAVGNSVAPCDPAARSWDLLGALEVEWRRYPEGALRDAAKRALYCAVRDAARSLLGDRTPSLSTLNDGQEHGWRHVEAVLQLAMWRAPDLCQASKPRRCTRRATSVDLVFGIRFCGRHRIDRETSAPLDSGDGRNAPWDGRWWGCASDGPGGACVHAPRHEGRHDHARL